MGELGKKGVSAVKWGAISSAGRFLLQLGAGVALARILGPDVYGVFGMGLVVFMFSNFLADFGFGWGLVQKTDLSEHDVRFAFTWQVMTGLVAGGVLYLSAPALGTFFNDMRVIPVIRWLGLACVLNAAAAPALNLLKRDMNFRTIGVIQLVSYAVGYIAIGIPMALAGFGTAALVTAWLAQSATTLLGAFWKRPHALRPLFHYAGASAMFNVGATVFVTNLVNWLITNLDRVLVGRLLNAHAVGLYTAGSNLSNMPSQLLLSSLQPAFLAAGARMQDDLAQLRTAYLQILSTIWALIAPALTVMAVMAPEVVRLLYGPEWTGTGHVLALLFIAVPLQLTWCMTTPVLWNNHRKHYEFMAQLPVLALSAWGFYTYAGHGVEAAALVAVSSTLLRCIVLIGVTIPGAHIRLAQVLARVGRGLVLSATFGGITWAALQAVQWAAQSPTAAAHWLQYPLVSLAAGTLAALGLATAVMLWWPAALGVEASRMLLRFVPRLSKLIQPPALAVGS